jgi:hypothetical protein
MLGARVLRRRRVVPRVWRAQQARASVAPGCRHAEAQPRAADARRVPPGVVVTARARVAPEAERRRAGASAVARCSGVLRLPPIVPRVGTRKARVPVASGGRHVAAHPGAADAASFPFRVLTAARGQIVSEAAGRGASAPRVMPATGVVRR